MQTKHHLKRWSFAVLKCCSTSPQTKSIFLPTRCSRELLREVGLDMIEGGAIVKFVLCSIHRFYPDQLEGFSVKTLNRENTSHSVVHPLKVCPHFPPTLHWQYKNSMNGKTCRSLIFVSTGLSVAMILTSQNQNSYSPVHKIHHPHLWQMKSPNSYVPKTRKYQCSK